MAPRHIQRLKLIGLTVILWSLYLAPWQGPWWAEPLKPTLTALAFVILSRSLGFSSWPLTIAFSLSFFLVDLLMASVQGLGSRGDLSQTPRETQGLTLYLSAVIFSPITLWGPLIVGTSTYALLCAFRSSKDTAKI